ncbi:hypothetical protein Harman_26590 [Haloarcula mannanilytica]|uniref:Uncharacterized protein n=1 Tax=Haloarcula mannanilytica TaxID=2509225 RepID=A0A4C2EJP7_9EURY|nr:hypothetical protein Harman_26590 [Haloarcula mannanilytica]
MVVRLRNPGDIGLPVQFVFQALDRPSARIPRTEYDHVLRHRPLSGVIRYKPFGIGLVVLACWHTVVMQAPKFAVAFDRALGRKGGLLTRQTAPNFFAEFCLSDPLRIERDSGLTDAEIRPNDLRCPNR